MIETRLALTAWVLFTDREFWKAARHRIDSEDFPQGPLRWLTQQAILVWDLDKTVLTPERMAIISESEPVVYGTSLDEALDFYVDILDRFDFDENEASARRRVAEVYLRGRRIARQMDEAQAELDAGRLEDAESALDRAAQSDGETFKAGLGWGETADVPPQRPSSPTGFEYFDRKWLGGAHQGQLCTVIAPSNVGKSMALPFFAAQALKQHRNVLYYTNELREYDVFKRVVSALVQEPINGMDFREAKGRADQMLSRRRAMRDDPEHQGWFETRYRDAGVLTVRDIEAELEELRKKGIVIHMVILDGDDIGLGAKKFEKIYDMYFHIYAQLSNLAARRDIVIWTAAQATREAFKKDDLSAWHVGDSIWKIRKADMVLGLGQTEKAIDSNGRPFMTIGVMKDRFYGTRGRAIRVYPKFGRDTPGIVGFDAIEEGDDD